MSALYKLNSNDFVRGAVSAVFAAFFFAIFSVVNQDNFNLFTVDWSAVVGTALNAAVAAFVGYLGKNFTSDSQGNPFGIGSK